MDAPTVRQLLDDGASAPHSCLASAMHQSSTLGARIRGTHLPFTVHY